MDIRNLEISEVININAAARQFKAAGGMQGWYNGAEETAHVKAHETLANLIEEASNHWEALQLAKSLVKGFNY